MTDHEALERAASHLDDLLSIPRQVWLLGAGISRDAGVPLMYDLTKRVEFLLSSQDNGLEGFQPHEIGVFVRSAAQLPRARRHQVIGARWVELDQVVETAHGSASLSTMHLAKGLEFRAVVVMACDDEVVPLQ